jgi:integrase/recombinase XerD
MKIKYYWKSNIAVYLKGYLTEMLTAGYKFTYQERILRQFDKYCIDHIIPEKTLTKEVVRNFCYGLDSDAQSSRRRRICVLRNLAEYMKKHGCKVYLHPNLDKPIHSIKHVPYIYSRNDLKNIFTQIDNWKSSIRSSSNRKNIDPLLFRMLYGCGLRLGEALNLKLSDVDLTDGILKIRQAKNNKDRFVPMSDGLTEKCRIYSKSFHTISKADFYYFPGQYGGCYDKSTIYRRFRQYLWKAGISHSKSGPRIHDFRHTYCIHRLKKWVLDGKELTNLLPYLSAYLGHADFRGTEYYLKLTTDLYPHIISKMELSFGYIIPEKGEQDEKENK